MPDIDPPKPRKDYRTHAERKSSELARKQPGGGFADQKITPTKRREPLPSK